MVVNEKKKKIFLRVFSNIIKNTQFNKFPKGSFTLVLNPDDEQNEWL